MMGRCRAPPGKSPYARADFLAWEEAQRERWEFVDGVMTMTTGGTVLHNKIADNIVAALRPAARGRGCRTFAHNQKLAPPANEDVAYPDVAVVCGRLEDRATFVEGATILVEVASKSSRKRDHELKWRSYRSIDDLREYLIVDQDEAGVTSYSRDSEEEAWRQGEIEGAAGQIELPALGISLTLAQIYEDTALAP